MKDLNEQHRAREVWPSVTGPALGVDPCHVESQARRVGDWAANEIARLRAELAATQAREAQMRGALATLLPVAQQFERQASKGSGGRRGGPVFEKSRAALALPHDTAALDARIRAERAKERERCAKAAHEAWIREPDLSPLWLLRDIGDE